MITLSSREGVGEALSNGICVILKMKSASSEALHQRGQTYLSEVVIGRADGLVPHTSKVIAVFPTLEERVVGNVRRELGLSAGVTGTGELVAILVPDVVMNSLFELGSIKIFQNSSITKIAVVESIWRHQLGVRCGLTARS